MRKDGHFDKARGDGGDDGGSGKQGVNTFVPGRTGDQKVQVRAADMCVVESVVMWCVNVEMTRGWADDEESKSKSPQPQHPH